MEDFIIQATLARQTQSPDTLRMALAAADVAEDNRGQNAVVLDMRELTAVFDFFVIATGTSNRQLHAMADEIDRVLSKELGYSRMGIEGYDRSNWILLDFGNVVVHLLDQEAREYYALEQLWSDAKRVERPERSAAAS